MAKFVTKPVRVNAWQVNEFSLHKMPSWLRAGYEVKPNGRIGVYLDTPKGKKFVTEGNWIVQYEDDSQSPFAISDENFKARFKELKNEPKTFL